MVILKVSSIQSCRCSANLSPVEFLLSFSHFTYKLIFKTSLSVCYLLVRYRIGPSLMSLQPLTFIIQLANIYLWPRTKSCRKWTRSKPVSTLMIQYLFFLFIKFQWTAHSELQVTRNVLKTYITLPQGNIEKD